MENENNISYDYATFPKQFVSYKWYKPILVALLTFIFMLIFQTITLIIAAIWGGGLDFLTSLGTSYDDMNPYTGPGALAEIGGVAVLLPALALAALIVRDRPFSSYSSSRMGWNWKALFKCIGIAAFVIIALTIVEMIIPDPSAEEAAEAGFGEIRFTVEGAILCLILVPIQCVAEEYVFRGFLIQTFSSWFKFPIIGIILAAACFAACHPYNIIGVVTIFCNGLVWGFIAWKTKGLEATSALHIVNNLIAFAFGGLGLQATTSEISIISMVIAIITDLVYGTAVILLGKKYGWFTSRGDGAAAFNEKKLAKKAEKQKNSGRPMPPSDSVIPQYAGAQENVRTELPVPPASNESPSQPGTSPESLPHEASNANN